MQSHRYRCPAHLTPCCRINPESFHFGRPTSNMLNMRGGAVSLKSLLLLVRILFRTFLLICGSFGVVAAAARATGKQAERKMKITDIFIRLPLPYLELGAMVMRCVLGVDNLRVGLGIISLSFFPPWMARTTRRERVLLL